jgi:hypothetical protein
MSHYKCIRCGYDTPNKSHMKGHINRKNICKIVLKDVKPKEHIDEIMTQIKHEKRSKKYECNYCTKDFSRSDSCKRHEEICRHNYKETEHPKEETKEELAGTAALMELVKTLNDQLSEERKERKQDQKRMEELVKKAGVTNYTNTTNNNTMNIVILPYNQTDVSHLKDKDFYNSISRCIMSVPKLIEKTHFNPDKPENHNIYISNISKGHVMVWDGKKWLVKDQQDVVDDLIRDNEFRLEDWIEEGSKKYPKAMEKFKLYMSKRDEKGVPELVRKEVKMMLYNNRDMIQEIKD